MTYTPPLVKVREMWVRAMPSGNLLVGDAQYGRDCKRDGVLVYRLRVIDGHLVLCDEAGEPLTVEAVES
jgi:hypothetical protein